MYSKNILQKRVKIKTPVASLVKSTNSERINHANVAQTQKIGKEGTLLDLSYETDIILIPKSNQRLPLLPKDTIILSEHRLKNISKLS